MICISKRGINFHPSISIKSNGITSHYSEQPRSVTLSYKYAVRSDSICFFDEIILRFKLEAIYIYDLPLPVSLVIIILILLLIIIIIIIIRMIIIILILILLLLIIIIIVITIIIMIK